MDSNSSSVLSSSSPFDQSLRSPSGLQIYINRCTTPVTATPDSKLPPLLFCIHGANHSALSFALFSSYLKEVSDILTFDLRGHGQSMIDRDTDSTDISLETLVKDCFYVLDYYLQYYQYPYPPPSLSLSSSSSSSSTMNRDSDDGKTYKALPASTLPKLPIVLVGHSLGASLVTELSNLWSSHYYGLHSKITTNSPTTHSSSSSHLPFRCNPHLAGLVMIDFTEGGALSSLQHMEKITHQLAHQTFPSPEEAIDWSLQSHMLKLRTSAELSIPSCLQYVNNVGHMESNHPDATNEMLNDTTTTSSSSTSAYYRWRAAEFLVHSSLYWKEWFTGSTEKFLSSSCPRLLFVSSMDRLSPDGALMAGQVSGKYQLSIIPGTGHVMHEDAPDKLALVLRAFLSRNALTTEIENSLLRTKLHHIQERKHQRQPLPSGSTQDPPSSPSSSILNGTGSNFSPSSSSPSK